MLAVIPRKILMGIVWIVVGSCFWTAWAHAKPSPRRHWYQAEVEKVSVQSNQHATNIIIQLNREAPYHLKLSPDGKYLFVDIRRAGRSKRVKRDIPVNDGRVFNVKVGDFLANIRFAVSLDSPTDYEVYTQLDPFRIVIHVIRRKPPKPEVFHKPFNLSDYIQISGYLEHQSIYRLDPADLTKIRNLMVLSGTGWFTSQISYKVSGRVFHDAVFELTDNFSQTVEDDLEFESQLRESYLDISLGSWDVRLGKQQIVWGEAIGLFFADVVNAKDLREFILPDFDFIRIPQWGMDLEWTGEAVHLEAIWLVKPEMHKSAVPGSDFAPMLPVPSGVPVIFNATDEPENKIKNSEFGGRFNYVYEGWDLGVFYLRTWDKFATLFRTFSAPVYIFDPEHKRLDIAGLTLAKEFAGIVFRGEAVLNKGKYFSTLDLTDTDGVIQKDFLEYLVGVDYALWGGVSLNAQFMQRIIFGFEDSIFAEKKMRSSGACFQQLSTFSIKFRLKGVVIILHHPVNHAVISHILAFGNQFQHMTIPMTIPAADFFTL